MLLLFTIALGLTAVSFAGAVIFEAASRRPAELPAAEPRPQAPL